LYAKGTKYPERNNVNIKDVSIYICRNIQYNKVSVKAMKLRISLLCY
jgi:hypothetical protein